MVGHPGSSGSRSAINTATVDAASINANAPAAAQAPGGLRDMSADPAAVIAAIKLLKYVVKHTKGWTMDAMIELYIRIKDKVSKHRNVRDRLDVLKHVTQLVFQHMRK